MFNIIIKNQRTGAMQHTDTAPDAYSADRKVMRLLRTLDADHIAYIEPVQGWDAEAARASQIAADWQTWRREHGLGTAETAQ